MEHQRSIPELIRTAKALKEKAEHATGKAEQFYVTLGLTLTELKERKPLESTWPAFVKQHFNLSRARADELIRIASGKTTVTASREGKRDRMRKVRATDTLPRGSGSNGQSLRADQFVNAKGVVKTACDFNPEDPDDVAEPGDSDEVINARIFMNRAREALRHAREIESQILGYFPVQQTMVDLAEVVAKEWSALATDLKRRKKKGVTGHEEEEVHPALH